MNDADAALKNGEKILSIGIALPGGITPEDMFDGKVKDIPFEEDEDIVGDIIDCLAKKVGLNRLEDSFGMSDPHALRSRIHLDNDVRSAARWLTVENGRSWRDFACIFVGSALGSGLVFDREVYFGNQNRAGELGHANLNLGDTLQIGTGTSALTLAKRKCSCGVEGYHFESLVGIGGLGHLASAIDSEQLSALRTAYNHDDGRKRELVDTFDDPVERDGMIVLRALSIRTPPAPRHLQTVDAMFARLCSDNDFRKILSADAMTKFLDAVLSNYVNLFATGIAALNDILDFGHIAICGTIPEYLWNSRFSDDLTLALFDKTRALGKAAIRPTRGSMLDWGWRGAALMPRDPNFIRCLGG